MNEQYSFFRKDERSPTLNHSNWTDDRVMQIMKKYEKPHRANQNHTHKKDHYDKSASPYTPSPYLKTEPQERSPVLGERNLNLDRNYSRQNDQKWSRPANQKDYCPG